MKNKKRIFILLMMIITAAFISSCGAGLPSGDEQTDKSLFVDMGTYSVSYPVRDDWSCKKDKLHKSIHFKRQKVWWTGVILGETSVTVFENEIKNDTTSLDEKQAAVDYRENELKIMKEEGVAKGQFDLDDITKFDTLFNGKKFYCMGYTSSWGTFFDSMTMESMLALFFPANFSTKHVFYTFLIDDSRKSDSFTENDAGQLYPVLKSFKVK